MGGSPFDGRREGGRPGQLERGYTVILATSPLLSGQCLYSFPSSSRGKAPPSALNISSGRRQGKERRGEGGGYLFWNGSSVLLGGVDRGDVCIPSLYRVSTGGGGKRNMSGIRGIFQMGRKGAIGEKPMTHEIEASLPTSIPRLHSCGGIIADRADKCQGFPTPVFTAGRHTLQQKQGLSTPESRGTLLNRDESN